MVRANLPAAGVAAVLLVASAAVGQTPWPYSDYSGPIILPTSAEMVWGEPAETPPPPLELVEDGLVMSFAAEEPKDSSRIKPTPQKGAQANQPAASTPASACPDGGCEFAVEEFPSFCCLPFAAPCPPPQQQGCGGHKCHRRNKGGCNQGCGGGGYGGYGGGCGNPYLGWPFGMAGCPGFCAPPPQQQNCGGHRCHRHKGGCNQGCGGGYGGGYGYGGFGGWDGMGLDGFGCDGCCFGCYAPPPPQQNCGGHKCHRRNKGGCNQGCGGGGYGGYGNPWVYPVPGWSTYDDGYNGFADSNCMGGGGCGGKHHGRRRCHSCNQQQAPPCWPMPQPCFMDCCAGF
jgi:hypothetical protein